MLTASARSTVRTVAFPIGWRIGLWSNNPKSRLSGAACYGGYPPTGVDQGPVCHLAADFASGRRLLAAAARLRSRPQALASRGGGPGKTSPVAALAASSHFALRRDRRVGPTDRANRRG